jgi:hypothetical protein
MRADLYRRHALECLSFARGMTASGPKAGLLDMAQHWLALADQAEKNAKTELLCERPLSKIVG